MTERSLGLGLDRVRIKVMVGVRDRFRFRKLKFFDQDLGLGLERFFERRSGDRTRVDGVCEFEKVSPDQLCPSAKRD